MNSRHGYDCISDHEDAPSIAFPFFPAPCEIIFVPSQHAVNVGKSSLSLNGIHTLPLLYLQPATRTEAPQLRRATVCPHASSLCFGTAFNRRPVSSAARRAAAMRGIGFVACGILIVQMTGSASPPRASPPSARAARPRLTVPPSQSACAATCRGLSRCIPCRSRCF